MISKLKAKYVDPQLEKINYELPEQFFHTCTLKEGTIITVTVLQAIAAMTIAFLVTMLTVYWEQADDWWHRKFKDDFDPYWNNEYDEEIIQKFYPYWQHMSYALIGVEFIYFVTGLMLYYGILKKNAHPFWYLPWLTMTALLIIAIYLTILALIVVTGIIATFRDITVTWDMVPTILVFLYALAWSYGFIVVVAQYRRRRIVQWWLLHEKRTNKEMKG